MACRESTCCVVDDLVGSGFNDNFSNLNECEIISITTTSLANAAIDEPYSATLVSTGGTAPVTWSIVAGSLPAGLTLSGATISGTPTESGDFSVTVMVQDANDAFCTQTLTLTVVIDMPLNSAVYVASRDKIYAVRSGRVFKLNATTGAKESEARWVSPAMDDTYIAYDSTTDSLWATMRHSFGATSDASFPIKWLAKINPDTLAATLYSFRAGAGGAGVVTNGDNWFSSQLGPQGIKCVSGKALLLCYSSATQGQIQDLMRVDLTTNPPSETHSDIATLQGGAWADQHVDGNNLWYCSNDGFNGINGTDLTTLLTLTDFVQLNGTTDRPYGLTRNPGAAIYAVQGTQFVLKGTPAAVPVLRTVIDLGRANATPFYIKYAAFNSRIYIPLFKDDTVAVLNPADDSFTIKTGFDTPFDVVFTNSKAFAVQHAPQGLKEIV